MEIALDEHDYMLLRFGTMEDGALCDGTTASSADTLIRCERLADEGLMVRGADIVRGGPHPTIRCYHTTPSGVAAHGAFGPVSAVIN